MTYLLDTNVWVVFLRNPGSPVMQRPINVIESNASLSQRRVTRM
jgi:hypothetical protein